MQMGKASENAEAYRSREVTTPESPNKPFMVLPGADSARDATSAGPERRSTPRYPFTAAAELSEPRSQTRVTGRTSDLGLNGCYVDTLSSFPVGTIVLVRLKREQRQFEAEAKVVFGHAGMGMGLMFTQIRPEHARTLRAWISELSGEPVAQAGEEVQAVSEPVADASQLGLEALSTIQSLRQMIHEVVILLVRKKVISENEGMALLRQMLR